MWELSPVVTPQPVLTQHPLLPYPVNTHSGSSHTASPLTKPCEHTLRKTSVSTLPRSQQEGICEDPHLVFPQNSYEETISHVWYSQHSLPAMILPSCMDFPLPDLRVMWKPASRAEENPAHSRKWSRPKGRGGCRTASWPCLTPDSTILIKLSVPPAALSAVLLLIEIQRSRHPVITWSVDC